MNTQSGLLGVILGRLMMVLLIVGCEQPAAAPVLPPIKPPALLETNRIEKLTTQHLPNAIRVHARVISGGLPEGRAAFEELRALGVKTIVSVDGARPDVALAEQYGMRYVHLPHGYDGVPQERVVELAKVVRDLPAPIYLHCHHGKHRSPAAAAVACVGANLIAPGDAITVLNLAGTSPNYRGLYESAKSARPLDQKSLDRLTETFPAVVELPALAEAMVQIEHTHDQLKAFETQGWKLSPDQPVPGPDHGPDYGPDHAALLLREHYTELLRTPAVTEQPERFRQLLTTGEAQARQLEESLAAWVQAEPGAPLPEAVPRTFKMVSDGCKQCHQEFRDVPLSEKHSSGKLKAGSKPAAPR